MRNVVVLPVSVALGRVKQILQKEGLLHLLKVLWFARATYYLYIVNPAEALNGRKEADFLPKIQNFTLKELFAGKEADELAASGFQISSAVRKPIDSGQTALCIFVEQELAHIMWASITEEAKTGAMWPPFRIDFSKNAAYGGWTWTNPKYRGMGFCTYVGIKRLQSLKDSGIEKFRSITLTNNAAAQRTLDKLGHKKYAEARRLRILFWDFWREKPLT